MYKAFGGEPRNDIGSCCRDVSWRALLKLPSFDTLARRNELIANARYKSTAVQPARVPNYPRPLYMSPRRANTSYLSGL